MNKFWELVKESVIVQGIVTVGLVTSVIYMSIVQIPVPESINTAMMLSLGFYFGSKVQHVVQQARGQ
jgi:hypothetical protein